MIIKDIDVDRIRKDAKYKEKVISEISEFLSDVFDKEFDKAKEYFRF